MEENIDQLCKIAGEFGMRGVAARDARAAAWHAGDKIYALLLKLDICA